MPITTARIYLWPLLLAAAAILGSLATACMMPFVAVATLAGITMPRGAALVSVLGAWAANQLLGFGLLGYPWTAYAFGWGAALGMTAVVASEVARAIGGGTTHLPRAAAAFLAAFATWEILLFGLALVTGGTGTFAPAIVAKILLNDALWFVGLGALYVVLIRAAPRWFGGTPVLSRG